MMKKTAIMLCVLLLACLVSQDARSQNNMQKRITVIAKSKSLKDVLNDISAAGGINFSYNNAEIDADRKISLISRRQTVESVISKLSNELNLSYTVIEKQVILKPKPPAKLPEHDKEPAEKPALYTLSGYLQDAENQEMLIGAVVMLKRGEFSAGTVTNAYGFYSLSVPPGTYELSYSYLGYEKMTELLKLNRHLKKNAALHMNIQELNIVLVTNDNAEKIGHNHPLRTWRISQTELTRMSAPGSTGDAVKSMQAIPGISLYGEGSVMYNVRGGDTDQNVIYLDEAPVYNPAHLFGFFSAIAPDAVSSMRVYKSDFPVQYGGRLSSFTDIRTKDGDLNNLGAGVYVSPLMSEYSIDGPIRKEKSAFLLTFRHSHLNYLYRAEIPDLLINFYDLHAKYNHRFNRKHRLYISFFSAADDFSLKNTAIRWSNGTFTIRKNRLFSDKLFSNATVYAGTYRYNFYFSLSEDIYWTSDINNLSFKHSFSFFPNAQHSLYFGYGTSLHSFNPGNLNYEELSVNAAETGNVFENFMYAGGEYQLSSRLSAKYGLRLTNRNNYGPTTVYAYDNDYQPTDTLHYGAERYNTYNRPEWRLSVLYNTGQIFSASAAYDRNVQFLQFVSNSISPFTSLDVWLPAGPNIKPQTANQYTISAYVKLSEWQISGECYYKKMKQQIDFSNQPRTFLNPYIEGTLRFGEAKAYGTELSVKKPKGTFQFIANYTYARVIRQTEGVNNNQPYPAVRDKPHNFYTHFSYQVSRQFSMNLSFIYASGNRFSSPVAFYYYQNRSVPIYGDKNNNKLPDYHRLDLAFQWQLHRKAENRFKHFINFSIHNVYARQNAFALNFNKTESQNGQFLIPSDYAAENELLPTGYNWPGIIPMLSYRFKFR